MGEYNCSTGLLLPLIDESTWSMEGRAFLYLLGLLYCFLGVAIIADVFMCAIEKITSKKRRIVLSAAEEGGEPDVIEVKVWNETVANLTLMALGSSAPEILLSIIEIVGNNFKAGDLGPGTIVGSAAFNLLVICGVCIMAIPSPQIRRIRMIKVFAVTAFFSIFAYLWLLVVLSWVSPDVVEVWEGVVTLLFFVVLVGLAYAADKGFFLPGSRVGQQRKQMELQSIGDPKATAPNSLTPAQKKEFFAGGKLNKDTLLEFIREVRKHPGLTDEDAAALAAARVAEQQAHTRMWYRVGAIRDITGGRKTRPSISPKLQQKLDEEVLQVFAVAAQEDEKVLDGAGGQGKLLRPLPHAVCPETAIVEFNATSCAVLERAGKVDVIVRRKGLTTNTFSCRIETIDGTALAGEDYIEMKQILQFGPNELQKTVSVVILDDNQWEPDENFFLRLSVLPEEDCVIIGRKTVMEITIIDDDEPGIFEFRRRGLLVRESIGQAQIAVQRSKGADGVARVKWRTIDRTAVSPRDYVGGEGELVFENGETEKSIDIIIVDDFEPEKDEHFEIELLEPSEGSALGTITRTTVTITNDDDFNTITNRLMLMTNVNVDKLKLHSESYIEQIKDAMNVNGGDLENATTADYVMHFLTFGWKVLFSLVPPTGFLGGWLTFFVSLGVIGVLTAIVGDLAGIFGCLVGLEDTVTAITFVALGTSLPDLFASRSAARSEKYADNAIGNVTGSNSVNVFLGLGLPWLIASIYWESQGEVFVVKSGALGFSVGIYCAAALLCIGLFLIRRFSSFFGKGELGGPAILSTASAAFLFLLWLTYIVLSALRTYKKI